LVRFAAWGGPKPVRFFDRAGRNAGAKLLPWQEQSDFDRGGYSPKLFLKVVADGFDILTYRKGRSRRVPKACFKRHKAVIDGQAVSYHLADQNVRLLRGGSACDKLRGSAPTATRRRS